MRLRAKDMRCVYVRPPREDAQGDDRYAFKLEGVGIWAQVQPYASELRAQANQWGITPGGMLVMYAESYPGNAQLGLDFGVCVNVSQDAGCDYVVIGVDYWADYVKAYLSWISPERRGA